MEEKGRSGGKTALHILAFVGVGVLLTVIALAAALFIATKGPSESAREAVYDWAAERNMQGIAGIFLSSEERAELADAPGENPPAGEEEPAGSEQPMISVTDELPAQETPAETEGAGEEETESGEEEAGS